MNKILQDLTNTGKVTSFIDDVIIGIEMEEIVKRLAENDLYVKPEKCKWKVREVGFLEIVIGPEGIKIKENKMKGVLDWLTSKCVKNMQKFLGLANYYCQFIKDFVSMARPLYDMIKKNQKQKWTERQEKIFRKLKERFTKELVLAALDLDKKMRIEVDVSDYAIGGVSSMKCEDRKQRPVAFLSQTSFSLYLHNQQTDFHKLSYAGKPQMRAIHTYMGGTKATTND